MPEKVAVKQIVSKQNPQRDIPYLHSNQFKDSPKPKEWYSVKKGNLNKNHIAKIDSWIPLREINERQTPTTSTLNSIMTSLCVSIQ